MKKDKIVWLTIGCTFLLIMIFCAKIYRPWIYRTGLFDFYIADTYTNLFSIPTLFFLGIFFQKSTKVFVALSSYASVYILGEIISWLLGDIFDYKDIIATFVGCGLALLIYKLFSTYIKVRSN